MPRMQAPVRGFQMRHPALLADRTCGVNAAVFVKAVSHRLGVMPGLSGTEYSQCSLVARVVTDLADNVIECRTSALSGEMATQRTSDLCPDASMTPLRTAVVPSAATSHICPRSKQLSGSEFRARWPKLCNALSYRTS